MMWYLIVAFTVLLLTFGFNILLLSAKVAWQYRVMAWVDERDAALVEIFQAVKAVTRHEFSWGQTYKGRFGPNSHYRGLAYEGTELNYETLAHMVMENQDQQALLLVAFDHLALWEHDHPVPQAPTLFGRPLFST